MSLLLLLLCSSSPDLAKKTIIIQKSNGIYFMSEYASEFGCIREFVGEFASFLWQKDDGEFWSEFWRIPVELVILLGYEYTKVSFAWVYL